MITRAVRDECPVRVFVTLTALPCRAVPYRAVLCVAVWSGVTGGEGGGWRRRDEGDLHAYLYKKMIKKISNN